MGHSAGCAVVLAAAEWMIDLAERFPGASGLLERALNQAARELYLAQSSDWAFLMTVGLAAISYRYLESPFLRWKARLARVSSRPV